MRYRYVHGSTEVCRSSAHVIQCSERLRSISGPISSGRWWFGSLALWVAGVAGAALVLTMCVVIALAVAGHFHRGPWAS